MNGSHAPSSSSSQRNVDSASHPTEEAPGHFSAAPSAPPHPSDPSDNVNFDGIDVDDVDPPGAYSSLSLYERARHHLAELIAWFHSQSDDVQTFLKVAAVFLVLCVALGSRFGLDYALGGKKSIGRRGNYGEGNACDRYSSSRNRKRKK